MHLFFGNYTNHLLAFFVRHIENRNMGGTRGSQKVVTGI